MVKGLIIAAGYGTRFLPATKTVPKEMFPLVNKPSILFIVEEMVEAGITEIVMITSRRKKCMEDYFDREMELEATFKAEEFKAETDKKEKDAKKAREKLAKIATPKCSIAFVRQEEMRGTGHAILTAAPFIGDSPFVMAFPDDIFLGKPSVTQQIVDTHKKTQCSVLALFEETGDVSRYGVAEVVKEKGLMRVTNLVEKPAPGTEPSKLTSYGRFLLTPDIFPHLKKAWDKYEADKSPEKKKEFYHTEGILGLIKDRRVVGHCYTNQRLDTGEPYGYLESMIEYALTQPEFRDPIMAYMKKKVAGAR